MITVHHLEQSRSLRVLWMLEELGLEYEVVTYQRNPNSLLAPKALQGVHPLGKAPVLVDGDKVLAESGAILEYLVDVHDLQRRLSPPLAPLDAPERLRYRYWMHYAEGSAMPPLLLNLVFSRIRSSPMPFFVRPIARGIADKVTRAFIAPQLKLHLDWVEQALQEFRWFAGERFTAADIQMSFPLQAAAERADATTGRPALQAFLQRAQERPAYQRALLRAQRSSVVKG
jgi:glutathione S-transferase